MKRIFSLLTVLLLCVSLACPVFAANNTFVPSISEKDHPDIVPSSDGYPAMLCDDDGTIVGNLNDDCIVVTPASKAKTSGRIPQGARMILQNVYSGLTDGSMKIPYGDATEWVIRDLFDVSLLCGDHPAAMEKGANMVVTFNLGVGEHANVNIMVYDDGNWYPAVKTVNNGDGTVTVTLDHLGVVAISVPAGEAPKTGDNTNVTLWVVLMATSAAALAALVIFRRKAVR